MERIPKNGYELVKHRLLSLYERRGYLFILLSLRIWKIWVEFEEYLTFF